MSEGYKPRPEGYGFVESEEYKIPKDYELVYMSGHTNTYCNGEKHFRTSGGWAGQHLIHRTNNPWEFKCDCHKYEEAVRKMHDQCIIRSAQEVKEAQGD